MRSPTSSPEIPERFILVLQSNALRQKLRKNLQFDKSPCEFLRKMKSNFSQNQFFHSFSGVAGPLTQE